MNVAVQVVLVNTGLAHGEHLNNANVRSLSALWFENGSC